MRIHSKYEACSTHYITVLRHSGSRAMAIHRGFQSAVFYYLSCAPCAEARVRRKRKKEAKYDRADREMLEAQMPNLYRHPSPSSTNPYWQADIELGPVPISRGGKRKKKASATGSESQRGLKTSATQSSHGSGVASTVELPRLGSLEKPSAQSWRHHQRADEELWGSEAADLPLESHRDGPTIPPKARTANASRYRSYRNPAVNDLHPAIVTRVTSRNDVAWMLQPPPVADVMSGKQRPSRSGSASGSIPRPTSFGSAHLSTQGSRRTRDGRLLSSRGSPATNLSRETSSRSANNPTGQRHDRDHVDGAKNTTTDKDLAKPAVKRRIHRPAPLVLDAQGSEDSTVTVIHNSSAALETSTALRKPHPRKLASRPQLSTILSDNTAPAEIENEYHTPPATPKENSEPSSARNSAEFVRDKNARRSAILFHDSSSLKALQDRTPRRRTLFNTRLFATSPPLFESAIRIPASDEDEDNRLSSGGPELFDSWYTPEFQLDKWVHEHTKREVAGRQRWSMDI